MEGAGAVVRLTIPVEAERISRGWCVADEQGRQASAVKLLDAYRYLAEQQAADRHAAMLGLKSIYVGRNRICPPAPPTATGYTFVFFCGLHVHHLRESR